MRLYLSSSSSTGLPDITQRKPGTFGRPTAYCCPLSGCQQPPSMWLEQRKVVIVGGLPHGAHPSCHHGSLGGGMLSICSDSSFPDLRDSFLVVARLLRLRRDRRCGGVGARHGAHVLDDPAAEHGMIRADLCAVCDRLGSPLQVWHWLRYARSRWHLSLGLGLRSPQTAISLTSARAASRCNAGCRSLRTAPIRGCTPPKTCGHVARRGRVAWNPCLEVVCFHSSKNGARTGSGLQLRF